MVGTNGKFKQLRSLVCVVLNHIITHLTLSFLLSTHVFGGEAVAQEAGNERREAQERSGRRAVAQRGNECREGQGSAGSTTELSERGNGGSETSQRQEGNAGTDDGLTTAIRDAALPNAA